MSNTTTPCIDATLCHESRLGYTDTMKEIQNVSHTTLHIPAQIDMAQLLGSGDEFLHLIEDDFAAHITARGNELIFSGDKLELKVLVSLFTELISRLEKGEQLTKEELRRTLMLLKTSELSPQELRDDLILTNRGRAVRPKTAGQKSYVDAIRSSIITFGIGPAGTGKTYLAMAMAIAALKRKEVGRIILVRPVVEAGENLGFLPGTLEEKIDPYLRPLYDALFDMTSFEEGRRYIEEGLIEIAPLAFMRGRTFNDSFIILDEAQNTTPEQMKMFLTRLGFSSKMVITGDLTQIDLPQRNSGLIVARSVLDGLDDISFCTLSGKDVIRHSLVARIVSAYAKAETQKDKERPH